MKKFSVLVPLLFVTAISTCSFASDYGFKETRERTFKMQGDDLVEIGNTKGLIQIIKSKDDELHVNAKLMANNEKTAKLLATREGYSQKDKSSNSWYEVIQPSAGNTVEGDWFCNLTVAVPDGKRIKATIDDGEIQISGVQGTFTFHVKNGSIIGDNLKLNGKQKSTFEIVSGNVEFKSFDLADGSKAIFSNHSGNVFLKFVDHSIFDNTDFRLAANNGKITIAENLKHSFKIKDKKASMTATLKRSKPTKTINAQTDRGSITIE
ncbi:MAG: hypothetical protein ABIE74_03770 [Pseudomonadota bacterium]